MAGIFGQSYTVVAAAAIVIALALGFLAVSYTSGDGDLISPGAIFDVGDGVGAEQGAISVSLPFQATVINPYNASRYGATSATLNVIGDCTATSGAAGELVPIERANSQIAESCDLSRGAEGTITCSTTSPYMCTSSNAYKTGETIVFHVRTTEKGGAYGRLFAITFSNSMVTENSNGARIFDIPPLEVYDRIAPDHIKFAIVAPDGNLIGDEADGNTFSQKPQTGTRVTADLTGMNNFTATSQQVDAKVRVRSTGDSIAGRSTCWGFAEPELRNIGGTPELRWTVPIAVVSFTGNVDSEDLIADGWTKMSSGSPDANVTFWQELPALCIDSVASNLDMSVPLTIDTSRIAGSTNLHVNLWIADLQDVNDVNQGAGSTSNTARFAFSAVSTSILGNDYTTSSGSQVADNFVTVGRIITSS
jgi:hypothetical protein